jgi:hypothetical protein
MIYSYKCPKCHEERDVFRSVAARVDAPECCGYPSRRVITPVRSNMVLGAHDNPGYISPMSGLWVDSQRKRRDEMVEFNVREKG